MSKKKRLKVSRYVKPSSPGSFDCRICWKPGYSSEMADSMINMFQFRYKEKLWKYWCPFMQKYHLSSKYFVEGEPRYD